LNLVSFTTLANMQAIFKPSSSVSNTCPINASI
jgi:hypothetical protein